jgi:hypothetical protein
MCRALRAAAQLAAEPAAQPPSGSAARAGATSPLRTQDAPVPSASAASASAPASAAASDVAGGAEAGGLALPSGAALARLRLLGACGCMAALGEFLDALGPALAERSAEALMVNQMGWFVSNMYCIESEMHVLERRLWNRNSRARCEASGKGAGARSLNGFDTTWYARLVSS